MKDTTLTKGKGQAPADLATGPSTLASSTLSPSNRPLEQKVAHIQKMDGDQVRQHALFLTRLVWAYEQAINHHLEGPEKVIFTRLAIKYFNQEGP